MYSPRHALAALEEGHGHGLNSHISYFIMLFAFFKSIFIMEVSPRIAMVWVFCELCKIPCTSSSSWSESLHELPTQPRCCEDRKGKGK